MKLGYNCLAREVILDASEEYNVPEIKLLKAVEEGPSVFDRLTRGKDRYIAYVQAASVKALIFELQLDQSGLEVTASEGRVLVRLGAPRVHAGSFSGFGDHYAQELRRRLLARSAGLTGFTDLEVAAPEE